MAHLADLHIGSVLHGLEPYPGAPEIDPYEAPYAALRAAADRITAGGYDAVLIAGDVFDRRHADGRALAAFQEILGAFHEAGLPTVVVSGNHDAETPLPGKLLLPSSARWLAADAPESVLWPDLGITVHGQSVGAPDETRDLAAGYPRPVPGTVNIGLVHTSLHGAWSRRTCAPTTLRTLRAAGYAHWALGHVHHRLAPAPDLSAAYAGNTHGRGPDEPGGRGFAELLFGADGRIEVRDVHTAPVRYESLHLPHGAVTEAAVRAGFAAVPPPGPADAVVWTVHGPADPDLLHLARALACPRSLVRAATPAAAAVPTPRTPTGADAGTAPGTRVTPPPIGTGPPRT
ncbi:exonuclease SbcCD subunit D [Streptomyces sp. NPDC091268]|uniref:metallophosphoesterase family protein n=1 Tax=Streptomyces sp. NPDC091268 TaxID=3365979 RepID=UPI00380019C4